MVGGVGLVLRGPALGDHIRELGWRGLRWCCCYVRVVETMSLQSTVARV